MNVEDFDIGAAPKTMVHRKYTIYFKFYNINNQDRYWWYHFSEFRRTEIVELQDVRLQDISEEHINLLLLKYSML